jgi:hypothetical protein
MLSLGEITCKANTVQDAGLITADVSRHTELTRSPRATERATRTFTVRSRIDPTVNVLVNVVTIAHELSKEGSNGVG